MNKGFVWSYAVVMVAYIVGLMAAGSYRAYAVDAGQSVAVPTMRQPAPIPEGDVRAIIKENGLVESEKAVRDLLPGWSKPKLILVAIDRSDRLAWLQEAVPGVKLVGIYNRRSVTLNDAEAMPYIADADALVNASTNLLCTDALLNAAKKLKWMQYAGAGSDDCVPKIDAAPEGASKNFLLTGSQKLRSTSQSDNAIALMVALMRGIDLFVRMDVSGHIQPPRFGTRGWQIEGRTLLVVGLGGIGTDIARKAHGLGMKVMATRASGHQGPAFVEYVGLAGELPSLIGRADVVIIAAPLTPATRGLFNAALLARMKRGALLVNIARGQEVVTDDVVAALNSGQLGGFGTEVTDPEPLPDHHPLFSAPNVIITTHGGAPAAPVDSRAMSDQEKIWLVTRENMRRYAVGEKMLNVVDLARGY